MASLKSKPRHCRLPALLQLVRTLEAHRSLINIRNKALLLIGYFGAFRRSELVSLRWEHVEFVSEGLLIQLGRSKTDQSGEGFLCAIPFGPAHYCPVRALLDWREASGQYEGALFRRITREGKVLSSALCAAHWNRQLKRLAHQAKLPNADQISSHSLRRGSTTVPANQPENHFSLKMLPFERCV